VTGTAWHHTQTQQLLVLGAYPAVQQQLLVTVTENWP
jgi:hypothetical protein